MIETILFCVTTIAVAYLFTHIKLEITHKYVQPKVEAPVAGNVEELQDALDEQLKKEPGTMIDPDDLLNKVKEMLEVDYE